MSVKPPGETVERGEAGLVGVVCAPGRLVKPVGVVLVPAGEPGGLVVPGEPIRLVVVPVPGETRARVVICCRAIRVVEAAQVTSRSTPSSDY